MIQIVTDTPDSIHVRWSGLGFSRSLTWSEELLCKVGRKGAAGSYNWKWADFRFDGPLLFVKGFKMVAWWGSVHYKIKKQRCFSAHAEPMNVFSIAELRSSFSSFITITSWLPPSLYWNSLMLVFKENLM